MAGRLEQYEGFLHEARNNVASVKPMDNRKDAYGRERDLSGMNTMEVLSESRAHSLMCYLVYKKKTNGHGIYRPAVVPKNPIRKTLPRDRIEIIDLKSMTRKTILLANLKKAVPTNKKIGINQAMIRYPER